VKVSEEVLKRQEEALKKYVSRSKGISQPKERKSIKKKSTSSSKDRVVLVEKLE
jgi:hypothetical protein